MLQTFEEITETESLCKYCDADPGWHSDGCGNPYCCEGAYCEEAYKRYLDDLGISDTVVKIAKKTKVTIEKR